MLPPLDDGDAVADWIPSEKACDELEVGEGTVYIPACTASLWDPFEERWCPSPAPPSTTYSHSISTSSSHSAASSLSALYHRRREYPPASLVTTVQAHDLVLPPPVPPSYRSRPSLPATSPATACSCAAVAVLVLATVTHPLRKRRRRVRRGQRRTAAVRLHRGSVEVSSSEEGDEEHAMLCRRLEHTEARLAVVEREIREAWEEREQLQMECEDWRGAVALQREANEALDRYVAEGEMAMMSARYEIQSLQRACAAPLHPKEGDGGDEVDVTHNTEEEMMLSLADSDVDAIEEAARRCDASKARCAAALKLQQDMRGEVLERSPDVLQLQAQRQLIDEETSSLQADIAMLEALLSRSRTKEPQPTEPPRRQTRTVLL
eukprot:Sspe_Gene.66416::Locus_39245_Transcript_1_1_Confidence_1.000_Length_1682::g.66416::m.66416